ncbi:MAG: peptidylprolyl isomerase [Alphaproteobacteria bacterium]|nr:peptidylprolyl isomerase [Alphaproteobacteria bacterium]
MKKLKLTLSTGQVTIEMFSDVAPNHVSRISELVESGFYNGLTFHRVIDGFMAQTGCPRGDGTGGSGVKIPAEFSDITFARGTVGMARAVDINSADSQFFICFADCPFLDGQYTVWGRVVSGMENIDQITRGDEWLNGRVEKPDTIIRAEMVDE